MEPRLHAQAVLDDLEKVMPQQVQEWIDDMSLLAVTGLCLLILSMSPLLSLQDVSRALTTASLEMLAWPGGQAQGKVGQLVSDLLVLSPRT